ncbi:Hypothetical protein A7982_03546 [Minicystis rosea]|nr:Hypothetical protein A7982_03546 [Minicystis rosea]
MLLLVGVLRVGLGVAHEYVYVVLRRRLAGSLARHVAAAGMLLPIAGLVWSAGAALYVIRNAPPLGLRVLVEIPVVLAIWGWIEMIMGGAVVCAILVVHRIAPGRRR